MHLCVVHLCVAHLFVWYVFPLVVEQKAVDAARDRHAAVAGAAAEVIASEPQFKVCAAPPRQHAYVCYSALAVRIPSQPCISKGGSRAASCCSGSPAFPSPPTLRSHSISFARAQGVPSFMVGEGKGEREVEEGKVGRVGLGYMGASWGRVGASSFWGAWTLQQRTAGCVSVCSCQVNIGMALDPESAAYRFTVEIPLPIDTVRTQACSPVV